MKKINGMFMLILAAFLGAALAVHAEDSETPAETSSATAKESAPAEKKAPAKKKAKKPAKKKKKPVEKPVSEYKFAPTETVPTYRFDKQTNPIVKPAKPKKKSSKKGAAKKAAPAAPQKKLKAAPPIDDAGQVKQGELPAQPPAEVTGE